MAKVDANLFPKVILVEAASPATPAAGTVIAYAKVDGLLYSKDDAGTETLVSGGAGGGSSSFVGCRAFHSATQSIADATPQAVVFDSEDYDTSAIHDTVSNTSRFTIPTGKDGYWQFTAGTGWDTNTTGLRYLWWMKNAATEINGGAVSISVSAGTAPAGITTVTLALVATDYIQLMAYQTSGGARNIGGTSGDPKFETWCEARYLGA